VSLILLRILHLPIEGALCRFRSDLRRCAVPDGHPPPKVQVYSFHAGIVAPVLDLVLGLGWKGRAPHYSCLLVSRPIHLLKRPRFLTCVSKTATIQRASEATFSAIGVGRRPTLSSYRRNIVERTHGVRPVQHSNGPSMIHVIEERFIGERPYHLH
jgi:hypothetical protein